MRQPEALPNAATAPLTQGAPLDGEVRLVALTEEERTHLLAVVGDADLGPAATARLKLRAAAPVEEWGAHEKPSRFRELIGTLFQNDGRLRGECRWCHRKGRLDHYQLCERCAPAEVR